MPTLQNSHDMMEFLQGLQDPNNRNSIVQNPVNRREQNLILLYIAQEIKAHRPGLIGQIGDNEGIGDNHGPLYFSMTAAIGNGRSNPDPKEAFEARRLVAHWVNNMTQEAVNAAVKDLNDLHEIDAHRLSEIRDRFSKSGMNFDYCKALYGYFPSLPTPGTPGALVAGQILDLGSIEPTTAIDPIIHLNNDITKEIEDSALDADNAKNIVQHLRGITPQIDQMINEVIIMASGARQRATSAREDFNKLIKNREDAHRASLTGNGKRADEIIQQTKAIASEIQRFKIEAIHYKESVIRLRKAIFELIDTNKIIADVRDSIAQAKRIAQETKANVDKTAENAKNLEAIANDFVSKCYHSNDLLIRMKFHLVLNCPLAIKQFRNPHQSMEPTPFPHLNDNLKKAAKVAKEAIIYVTESERVIAEAERLLGDGPSPHHGQTPIIQARNRAVEIFNRLNRPEDCVALIPYVKTVLQQKDVIQKTLCFSYLNSQKDQAKNCISDVDKLITDVRHYKL